MPVPGCGLVIVETPTEAKGEALKLPTRARAVGAAEGEESGGLGGSDMCTLKVVGNTMLLADIPLCFLSLISRTLVFTNIELKNNTGNNPATTIKRQPNAASPNISSDAYW